MVEKGRYKIYQHNYYLANREKLLAAHRKWAINNPDKAKDSRERSRKKRINKPRQGSKDSFILEMLRAARYRAKKKNLPFDLSYDVLTIPERCPILNIPLFRGTSLSKDNSPSIDRIIPELGYINSNVRIISYRANRIKNDATLAELELILQYLKREKVN
jgi:hypothetical protein